MREFTDPFTGETLDNPTRKTYRVTYTVGEFGKQTTEINTLAEGRLTKAQAKEKLMGRPQFMMNKASDLSIKSVKKVDESSGAGIPGL